MQQPRQRDLSRRRPALLGDPGERCPERGEAAFGERVERNESDSAVGAEIDKCVGGAIPQIVGVLDRHDFRDRLGACKLSRRNV